MAISREQQFEIEMLLKSHRKEVCLLVDDDVLEIYAVQASTPGEAPTEIVAFKNGSRKGWRSTISSLIEELHGRINVRIITCEEASKILDTPTWRTKW